MAFDQARQDVKSLRLLDAVNFLKMSALSSEVTIKIIFNYAVLVLKTQGVGFTGVFCRYMTGYRPAFQPHFGCNPEWLLP